MKLKTLSFMILTISILSEAGAKQCPKCGSNPVPYPLSTGPDCGDPMYKIRCDGGTLWFDSLNGSTNVITSINPTTQSLILHPPGFKGNTCMAADFVNEGIRLDPNLPFNVSDTNTLIIMNCSKEAADGYTSGGFDCSSTSLCHKYLRDNPLAHANCQYAQPYCCWFRTGGTINQYKVYRARAERCAAYQSYVYLDKNLPVSQWGEPAVELQWALPREPACKIPTDCKDLLKKSMCLPDPQNATMRRCFCNKGFQWDPVKVTCGSTKCSDGKGCNLPGKIPMIVGLVLGVSAILVASAITRFICKRRCQARSNKPSYSRSKLFGYMLSAANSGGPDKIFTGKEIVKATNNFAKTNLLGAGGFGEVFKGILDDGTIIAVKRAKLGNEKGIDQIINEVRILCQVSHTNLVKLLGCCMELDLPILIYEYIPNGTLFDHLHGPCSAEMHPLTWRHRLNIAHQTAQAIAYLHSSAHPPIYHRDIKSSNILIDKNLDAKVADFGLSRLGITDVSHVTTCAQGTLGYLDPEYYLNFQLTDKSDVYSFGVVLLELLTSKRAIDFSREEEDVNLAVFVVKMARRERWVDVIDPVIGKGASEAELESMKAMRCLAEQCLKETRQNRPSMRAVAKEIETIINELPLDNI